MSLPFDWNIKKYHIPGVGGRGGSWTLIDSMVGRMPLLKDVLILIPQTCEYVVAQQARIKVAAGIELLVTWDGGGDRSLNYPGGLYIITQVLVSARGEAVPEWPAQEFRSLGKLWKIRKHSSPGPWRNTALPTPSFLTYLDPFLT